VLLFASKLYSKAQGTGRPSLLTFLRLSADTLAIDFSLKFNQKTMLSRSAGNTVEKKNIRDFIADKILILTIKA